MSGTHLYYNGVLFRDCETLDYSCVLEFDESGTHEKFMRTRITVASTLVSLYKRGTSDPIAPASQHFSTIQIPPVLSGADETTPARLEEIKELLSEPRKDFWYAVNGVTDPGGTLAPTAIPQEDRSNSSPYRLILVATGIYPTVTAATDPEDPPTIDAATEFVKFFDANLTVKRANVLDANNGPKPSGFGFTRMYGGNVVRIQATFEVCRVLSKPVPDADNPDPGYDAQKVKGVVSNSWNVVDSLDDDGAVTHTVNGKVCVKDKRYKANAMRMAAFPLAFPYARLVGRQYTVDHSGLVLEYQFQFRHAGAAPPQGIRKFEATYTETAGQGGAKAAGIFRASMNIKVMGWHDRSDESTALLQRERVQKMVLIRGAMTILNSRITGIAKAWNAIPGQNAKTTTLVDAKVIEKVGHPELELQVTVNYGDANRTEFISRLNNMGNPVPIDAYDPRWWPIDNEWGRLPDGNGAAGNNGDSDNPEFDNAAYPYAASGDPTKSDYFTGYFQSPGNNRHSLPRITGRTKTGIDISEEWARPGGHVPSTAIDATYSKVAQNANPITGPIFTAIVSKDLSGAVALGPAAFVLSDSYTGIAAVQESGFQYIAYSSEVMNDTAQGKINLPLSVPRDIPELKRESLLGLSTGAAGSITGKECSVALNLCAPETFRVYSVSTTRSQMWGQLPEPLQQIVRTTGSGSTRKIVQIETLVKKEFLGETPELRSDGITREFTHHMRLTYAASNPWRGTSAEGGGDDFETLPVGFSPVCKATAAQNAIVVKGDGSTPSPLFTYPQYG
jgi:hypothetical protein